MDAAQRHAAKVKVITEMQCDCSWREGAEAAGLQISQATAYRLLHRVRTEGEAALQDGRHGYASNLRAPIRQWLEVYCRASPACPSRTVQTALYKRFGVLISITTSIVCVPRWGCLLTPSTGGNEPQRAPESI